MINYTSCPIIPPNVKAIGRTTSQELHSQSEAGRRGQTEKLYAPILPIVCRALKKKKTKTSNKYTGVMHWKNKKLTRAISIRFQVLENLHYFVSFWEEKYIKLAFTVNATFNNISDLLVEKRGLPRKKPQTCRKSLISFIT